MGCPSRFSRQLIVGASLIVLLAPRGYAQTSAGRELGVGVGAMQFDLSGVGTAAMAAVHLTAPLSAPIHFATGVALGYADSTTAHATTWVAGIDLDAHVVLGSKRWTPFFGVGIGAMIVAQRLRETHPTLSGLAGIRLRLSPLVSARAQLRLRAIEPFHGSTAEWTVGMSWGR